MRLLNVTRWPWPLVFLVAGLMAFLSAFSTVNLFGQTVANLGFLRRVGYQAVELGALRQLAELVSWGMIALTCFMSFKVCETELMRRYRNWADANGADRDERTTAARK